MADIKYYVLFRSDGESIDNFKPYHSKSEAIQAAKEFISICNRAVDELFIRTEPDLTEYDLDGKEI